jgi:hypothetical protein
MAVKQPLHIQLQGTTVTTTSNHKANSSSNTNTSLLRKFPIPPTKVPKTLLLNLPSLMTYPNDVDLDFERRAYKSRHYSRTSSQTSSRPSSPKSQIFHRPSWASIWPAKRHEKFDKIGYPLLLPDLKTPSLQINDRKKVAKHSTETTKPPVDQKSTTIADNFKRTIGRLF